MLKTKKPKLIRTPIFGIPLGERVIKPDGSIYVRVKKPNEPVVEELPLDRVFTLFIRDEEDPKNLK